MQVNLAPELIIEPEFEQGLFGRDAVLEGHRINVNPLELQSTLSLKRIPSTRIHTVRLVLAPEEELKDLESPAEEDKGYSITTGISPDPLDAISIPLIETSPEPTTELERVLNLRIYNDMSNVAEIIKKRDEAYSAHGENSFNLLTATFAGAATVFANVGALVVGAEGNTRYMASIIAGAYAVKQMTKAKRRIPFETPHEQTTYDPFPPRILEIVERS